MPEENALTLTDMLLPLGFDASLPTKLVRHSNKDEDLEILFRKGREHFEIWQRYQDKEYFRDTRQLVVFFSRQDRTAALAGVYKVNGVKGPMDIPQPEWYAGKPFDKLLGHYDYELLRDERFDSLVQRLVIDWGKSVLSWHQWHDATREKDKKVVELLPAGYDGQFDRPFPGYLDFTLTHAELKDMVHNPQRNSEWHRALKSVSGVYLILDDRDGKQYIGSAYGEDGFLGRWSNYAEDGHGGNQQLYELVAGNPKAKDHFRYSILQVLSPSMAPREVIAHEGHYKLKLGSRAHGLNSN